MRGHGDHVSTDTDWCSGPHLVQAPLIHTAWHLLSAAGLAAMGPFLDDVHDHANSPP